MTSAFLLLAATAVGSPAAAQPSVVASMPAPSASSCPPEHAAMGHCTPSEPPPPPVSDGCSPEHAAMGHCTLPDPKPQPIAPACAPEHAAMGHCTLPQAPSAPVAQACAPEHAAMGHCTLPPSGAPVANIPVAPAPAEAFGGPVHAADAFWNGSDMARSRGRMTQEHGAMKVGKLLVDRAETRWSDGQGAYLLDMQGWYGGDRDKLWVKGEIEGAWGEGSPDAEVQALWSRAIDPWFDLQAGVRHDFRAGPDRSHLVLAVQGLAPYWWDVEASLFLSNKGELTARAEAEYDLRLTRSLTLQPRLEAGVSAQEIDDLDLGSGLTEASIGLRLRYQLAPRFAPYVGIEYERAFAETRRLRLRKGEDAGGLKALAGVRLWF